jgi:hypothetical protein
MDGSGKGIAGNSTPEYSRLFVPGARVSGDGDGDGGLIPGRVYDRTGVGFYWLKESDKLDSPLNLINVNDEWRIEAFYNVAITPSVQMTFDVQWIDSGINGNQNPVVIGMLLFRAF